MPADVRPTIGILVGGASRRMGLDKALLSVDGVTLLERTAAMAATVSDKVVLLGRPTFGLPRLVAPLRVVADVHPGIGPIGGLEALLLARREDACLLLACDMPRLSAELLKRLWQRACAEPEADAVICATGGPARRWHPCCGVYRPSVLPVVEDAIRAQGYGVMQLLSRLRVEALELAGDEARWVENWNEPDDVTGGRRERAR